VEETVRSALVIVTCLLTAACAATGFDPRPRGSGFGVTAGVADPYADGKDHLAAARYQLAIERFRQALANDRHSLAALNGLAIAHSRLGHFDVAQTYFERALQIDPTSAVTLNNYGWSLAEQGRLRHAKPFLEQALRRAADDDVPVVAANLESVAQARPPALITALDQDGAPEAASGQRFIRLAANVYRLETTAGTDGPPAPTGADDASWSETAHRELPAAVISPEHAPRFTGTMIDPLVVAKDGLSGATRAPGEQSSAAEPGSDLPVNTGLDAEPLASRPASPGAPEAAAIAPGDRL
jgi:hypothetical protein